jgi:hypothetical protein
MSNKHVVDITIIWPDDKWQPAAEQAYIASALEGVVEYFRDHPIENREYKPMLMNKFGRVYAELHINPAREG